LPIGAPSRSSRSTDRSAARPDDIQPMALASLRVRPDVPRPVFAPIAKGSLALNGCNYRANQDRSRGNQDRINPESRSSNSESRSFAGRTPRSMAARIPRGSHECPPNLPNFAPHRTQACGIAASVIGCPVRDLRSYYRPQRGRLTFAFEPHSNQPTAVRRNKSTRMGAVNWAAVKPWGTGS
jgi:hypothetical protein